jgi:hypothetical protein
MSAESQVKQYDDLQSITISGMGPTAGRAHPGNAQAPSGQRSGNGQRVIPEVVIWRRYLCPTGTACLVTRNDRRRTARPMARPRTSRKADRLTHAREQPSGAATLCLSLLPVPTASLDWAAMIGAARPLAGLTLMVSLLRQRRSTPLRPLSTHRGSRRQSSAWSWRSSTLPAAPRTERGCPASGSARPARLIICYRCRAPYTSRPRWPSRPSGVASGPRRPRPFVLHKKAVESLLHHCPEAARVLA